MLKKILLLTTPLVIALSCLIRPAFAAPINLYETPDENAKILKTIDTESKLIPIYYPKTEAGKAPSAWLKVADPKEGQVGWVKIKALKNPLVLPRFSSQFFEQETIRKENGESTQSTYRSVQRYPSNESVEKRAAEISKLFIHIQQGLQSMQKVIESFVHSIEQDLDSSEPFFTPLEDKPHPSSKPEKETQPSWWDRLKRQFMQN